VNKQESLSSEQIVQCSNLEFLVAKLDRNACMKQLQQHLLTMAIANRTRKLCYRKDDRTMRAIQVDREPLRRYGHSKLSEMAAAAILNLFELDPLSQKTPPYNQT